MDISAHQHLNVRINTRGKRPLRNLTPLDKVRAIQRIHNGETKASVSRDIGVPESTLRGWCKNEQKLRFICRQLDTNHTPVNEPPEKRLKFEKSNFSLKLSSDLSGEGYDYKDIESLSKPLDLASNVFGKIAFIDFLDKSNPASEHFIENSHILQYYNHVSSPSELSQFPIMQNMSLLSVLNSNLKSMSNTYAHMPSSQEIYLSQNQLQALSSLEDFIIFFKNISSNINMKNVPSLSDNYTKNPEEYFLQSNFSNVIGDQNQNTKTSPHLASAQIGPPAVLRKSVPIIFSGCCPYTTQTEDAESNNPSWWKLFNASLNYIALAAAAAALDPPNAKTGLSDKLHIVKTASERKRDTVLFNHLSTDTRSYPLLDQHMINSDNSNDSCFDSEPEDLSVQSANSAISSPPQSRSQSPSVLIISSTSNNTK